MATTSVLASPGIGSGLDVTAIVEKLMAVERRPLAALATQKTAFESKISAYGSLKSALAALDTALGAVATPTPFRAARATSSDTASFTASGSEGAAAGSYSVETSYLAQAQKLASAGFATIADTVGTGTLTLTFGTVDGATFTADPSQGEKTVAIAAGQGSLAGIRDAINAANVGVKATIVNDGSAAGQRLVLTSSTTGAVHAFKLGVADDDGNATDAAGLSRLAFDPAAAVGSGRNLETKVAAQDAVVTVDGIEIRRPTNTIADAIAGVTLTLVKPNAGAPGTVSVAANVGEAGAAVSAFVKAYNDAQSTITALTKYDTAKKTASVLTGDGTVRTVQSQLRSLIGGTIAGPSGSGPISLSQIGIKTDASGMLAMDTAKFNAAFAADAEGVARVFAAVGRASDPLVGVKSSGNKAVPGEYALDVTRIATRGALAGSSVAGLAITAGVNDTLSVTLDGLTASITLGAGTYASASALAAHVAGRINGAAAFAAAGASVSASDAAGLLAFTSTRYGSTSALAFAGSAAATLVGATPVATAGLDAAGTIGGHAVTGAGQILAGIAGSPLEGVAVTIAGGATGARGTVSLSEGVATRLSRVVDALLDAEGIVASRTDGVQRSIAAIEKRQTALERRLSIVEEAYLRQYRALDTSLAAMSATSTYLTQQLANLPKISDND